MRSLLRRVGVGRSARVDSERVDPRGPVFISYRQSDGLSLATETAWALRAAGVPVWRDQSDLPPGDTDRRLAEALESGLSGAVLLVTPEIGHSRVVREIEVPRLLELATNEAFTLSVLSTIECGPGRLDYSGPDRLLGQSENTLGRFMQEPAHTKHQRANAARAQCHRRMQAVREAVKSAGRVITIDVQTRIPPFAARADADLVLRLRPPHDGDRRPNSEGLFDLKAFLAHLPQLVALGCAEHVRVRGGAHLSVAFALGAALPSTFIGRVEAIDTRGDVWSVAGHPPVPQIPDQMLGVMRAGPVLAPTGPILVYLDLLPTRSDLAFYHLLAESACRFAQAHHVRPIRSGNLNPEEAETLVSEASQIIRRLADECQSHDVHLLLRCPWTTALLLGRTLNTLRVHLYEWEDGPDGGRSPARPRYMPSLVIRSGAGGSPIEKVCLPGSP